MTPAASLHLIHIVFLRISRCTLLAAQVLRIWWFSILVTHAQYAQNEVFTSYRATKGPYTYSMCQHDDLCIRSFLYFSFAFASSGWRPSIPYWVFFRLNGLVFPHVYSIRLALISASMLIGVEGETSRDHISCYDSSKEKKLKYLLDFVDYACMVWMQCVNIRQLLKPQCYCKCRSYCNFQLIRHALTCALSTKPEAEWQPCSVSN